MDKRLIIFAGWVYFGSEAAQITADAADTDREQNEIIFNDTGYDAGIYDTIQQVIVARRPAPEKPGMVQLDTGGILDTGTVLDTGGTRDTG